MNSIHEFIYKTVYDQVSKIVDPASSYKRNQSLDDDESSFLANRQILKQVLSGSPQLQDIANMPDEVLPAAFIELGLNPNPFQGEEGVRHLSMNREFFNVIVRIVVKKPVGQRTSADTDYDAYSNRIFDESTPVQLLNIRHTLDFMLDNINFWAKSVEREGYEINPKIWNTYLTGGLTLQGWHPTHDAADFRFTAEVEQQKTRSSNYEQ